MPGDVASKLCNSSQLGSPTLSFGWIPQVPGKRHCLEIPVAPESVKGGGSLSPYSPGPHCTDGKTGGGGWVLARFPELQKSGNYCISQVLLSTYYVLSCIILY